MKIVRVSVHNPSAAGTTDYENAKFGANGVIVQAFSDGMTGVSLSLFRDDGAVGDAFFAKTNASGGSVGYQVGLVLPSDKTRFTLVGGGSWRGRLIWVEDMVAPFGSCPMYIGSTTIAASTTQDLMSYVGIGWPAMIEARCSMTKKGELRLKLTEAGTALGITERFVGAGTAGEDGGHIGPLIYGGTSVSLQGVNLDGAASSVFSWCVFGRWC